MLEIYLSDLTPEKQAEVLRFYDYASAEDGNFDQFPLFTVEDDSIQQPMENYSE